MRALAAQLPEKAGELLGDAGLSAQNAAAWDLQSVFAWLLENLEQAYSAPLRFAGESLVLLLLGCAAALVLGSGSWKACLEAFCALAFGAASLSAMRQLTLSAEQTAASCQTYLLSFIPVFSSAAAAGGQTSGALAYSTMFLAMSNFLAWAIRTVILPLIQIYFCLSVSAAVWNNAGIEEAALLFARTLSFLLKSCGGVFTFVLGLQSVLAQNAVTLAYSYIGPKITWPIYYNGSIGAAKKDLYQTSVKLNEQYKELGLKAYISVNKALVTQASAAIPVVPLYITILYKLMKEMGIHEGCIEQMYRMFAQKLYLPTPEVDEQGQLRLDDWEMREDVQSKVEDLWSHVTTENLKEYADIDGYWEDFYGMFGFGIDGVDYDKDIDIEAKIPSIPE